ncbi:conserved exported hypothetical protein [Rubrivivax sp. A210]|uniref:hypothetical protein n=1 Tax=Rubrivivax sp. A210 TaxID=2772301 RepID=UPI00191927BF|nr:hypothetical protein [Rubrivivax sp. A210]CAD5367137.1 conserved exported hypothetical protein [Rubrivivax sp. A210]
MSIRHWFAVLRAGRVLGCAAAMAVAGFAAEGKAAVQDIRIAAEGQATEIAGQVKGYAGADYRVQGRAGQTLSVRMTVLANRGLSFNLAPEGAAEAMVIGDHSGLDAKVMLPADGAYVISTFLPRSAARRHESGRFRLAVAIAGEALAPLSASQDALVAGTRYHATARLSCRWAYAPAATTCDAGVVRRGHDATATVDIRGSDGRRRRLLFVKGQVVASDSAWPVSTRRNGDHTTVEIDGQERHEVPDALLTGG